SSDLTIVVPTPGPPPPNQNPTAAFTSPCNGLTCSFSATSSTDADGTVVSAAWDFGDTTSGTGLTTSHTFGDAGTFPVTVTVTDDDGGTAFITRDVSVTVPTASPITFVGQAATNANSTSHRVVVPATVQPGDGLILAFTASTNATIGTPTGVTGWRLLGTQSNGSMSTRLWTKVATAGNANAAISVTTSATSKSNFVVSAYRGTSTVDAVASVASSLETTSRATHTTPSITVASDRAWVVWYWAHEDSTTTTLIPPAGATVRSNTSQTGGGHITGLLADSNAAVGIGTTTGKVATAAAANSNATMWSIVLAPA
ncbi:MAG: domain containing protein, partial [Ilumatobacteraceae bacterium]|nr:domain containing protein [Ilumatobacteraceae bacterium]